MTKSGDPEKNFSPKAPSVDSVSASDDSVEVTAVYKDKWSKRLLRFGVEDRGVQPVLTSQRTDTQFNKIFFIWFSWNWNILTFSAGTLGPVIFGLNLRDTCLTILFFNLLCCFFPAYICTWGPKLGMRTMIISRYSFGYYGVIPVCILNLVSMYGFTILNCILGGQALASVNGTLSWTVGIVVISVISLLVSFCGYRVLNWYEKLSWIPVLITYIVVLAVGGKHLVNFATLSSFDISTFLSAPPATAVSILSYASTIAGFVITFSGLGTDFSIYYRKDVSAWRIFAYSYLGLLIPMVTLQSLGAAVACTVPHVPAWSEGYENGTNLGGLLASIVEPVGGFGKFVVVLFSLSVAGNIASTYYSAALNLQVFIPWLVVVPRYILSIVAFAIVLPLSIVGAHRFYDTLVNFLGLIGYWAGSYVSVLLIEHLYFRRPGSTYANFPDIDGHPSGHTNVKHETQTQEAPNGEDYSNEYVPGKDYQYSLPCWNTAKLLPPGLAAILATLLSLGLVIPSMHQVWFVGPIAHWTGDVGFEMAAAVTALTYPPLRILERRWAGR